MFLAVLGRHFLPLQVFVRDVRSAPHSLASSWMAFIAIFAPGPRRLVCSCRRGWLYNMFCDLAYADDILLPASTPGDLRALLTHSASIRGRKKVCSCLAYQRLSGSQPQQRRSVYVPCFQLQQNMRQCNQDPRGAGHIQVWGRETRHTCRGKPVPKGVEKTRAPREASSCLQGKLAKQEYR